MGANTLEPPDATWLHPSLRSAPSSIDGSGLFAVAPITTGTLVMRLGGRLVSAGELSDLILAAQTGPDAPYVNSVAVAEDRHLIIAWGTLSHLGNHSCDPNAWHTEPFEISARRNIAPGEELTTDYGTQSGGDGFVMSCSCASALCRGVVTSEDWRISELQDRYRGHWVPVLQARITEKG